MKSRNPKAFFRWLQRYSSRYNNQRIVNRKKLIERNVTFSRLRLQKELENRTRTQTTRAMKISIARKIAV